MDGVTRRACIAMGAVPVVAGATAYAAGRTGLWHDEAQPRFAPVNPGSARAEIQRRHLANVPLVGHDGRPARFYDDLVRNKKVVLTFVSSRAPGASREVTQNLAALQHLFGQRVGSDIFMYSIARTPEHDSAAALRSWAASSGAGLGWRFMTGKPADVERLRHGLGFASEDPAEDADPAYAVGLLRYGIEPDMLWGHCQSQATPRVLAHALLMDFGAGGGDAASTIGATF